MKRTLQNATTKNILSVTTEKYLALILLDVLFLTLLAVAAAVKPFVVPDFKLLPLFFLATFRLARTLSFNEIFEPFRAIFCTTKPDSCGAGANVHPKDETTGIPYAIGSLLACPICTGTWSAMALYLLWLFLPAFGIVLVYVLSFAGANEFIHWCAEMFEWLGRLGRVLSGLISPDKE